MQDEDTTLPDTTSCVDASQFNLTPHPPAAQTVHATLMLKHILMDTMHFLTLPPDDKRLRSSPSSPPSSLCNQTPLHALSLSPRSVQRVKTTWTVKWSRARCLVRDLSSSWCPDGHPTLKPSFPSSLRAQHHFSLPKYNNTRMCATLATENSLDSRGCIVSFHEQRYGAPSVRARRRRQCRRS